MKKKGLSRWLTYVKPYKLYFILTPIFMIVEVVGEVVMPRLLGQVINNAQQGTLTAGTSLATMALMILTALLMMAGGVGGAYFGAKASVNFATDVRNDAFCHIEKFSFANTDKFSTGSLVTRLTNDVTQLQNFVNMLLRMALRAPGMMIGGLIMAIFLKPKLSLVFAVVIPLLLLTLGVIIVKCMPKFTKMQSKLDKLNSTVNENVTNVRVVKSFVREDTEVEKFTTANRDLKSTAMSAMKLIVLIMPVMNVFMYAATIAVVWFGHGIVLDGEMLVGDLSTFITYVTQILSSLMMVAMLFMITSRAMASGKRIAEVLDEVPDISDEFADGEAVVTRGEISFHDVSFRYYKNSEECVLSHINLDIPAGKTVGIIGSTGSGKTTLVSLIPRLYDVDGGEVLVDGRNVKEYTLKNLREGVGMVLQKNLLFSGTIAENIRFGNETATDEEVEQVSKVAAVDKFVYNYPGGYDRVVEKGGANVSGGQKQRLCIARALIKKPKILILDDSTSAVDTATERQIREELHGSLKDSTKIIIAQRISSVKDADVIVVLNDGKIAGMGTHDELLSSNTEYREIYQSQTDGKEA